MNQAFAPLLAAMLSVAPAASAQTEAAGGLRHDPFDWSALQRLSEAASAGTPPAGAIKPAPAPRLRAVMHGPSGASADLSGVILGIGDSAGGYRLLEVREYSAVFVQGGAKIELEVGESPKQ